MKLNRKTLLLLSLLLAFFSSYAQSPQGGYGNEWYASDPSRTFIPIKVWEEGIYRLSANDLSAAGYDLSMVNPDFLQLFFRGAEQRIYVQQSNGSLEYLEFVGRHNDGLVDATMYRDPVTGQPDPSLQPQPYYSLFSDTAVYYLSWSNQVGLRLASYFAEDYGNYVAEPNFPYEQRLDFAPDSTDFNYVRGGGGQFDAFYTLNPDYVTGEGYVGPSFNYQSPLQLQLTLVAPDPQLQSVSYRARIFGRSNTPHYYRISDATGILWDTTHSFSAVSMQEYRFRHLQSLPTVLDLTVEALRSPTDNNHFCGLRLVYDRLPTLVGERSVQIANWDQNGVARFDLAQVNGNDTIYAWDLVQGIRSKGLITNGQGQILIPLSDSSQNVWLNADIGIRTPQIENTNSLHNLCATDSGAQFVIISHRSLAPSANAYALYRDTSSVEPMSAKVVYIDQIYEEFGYGSTTPLAIKRFVNCALTNWSIPPEYILIWGKGSHLTRHQPWNLIPYYGYPATDGEFVRDLEATTDVDFQLAIGRVNVQNNFDGFAYLDKLDAFEHKTPSAWQQRGIFLQGGLTLSEITFIRSAFRDVIEDFQPAPMHGLALAYEVAENDTLPKIIDDSVYFSWMNDGVGSIHYFGHATTNQLQFELGEPDDYQNVDRPIAMFLYGSYAVSSLDSVAGLSEKWMLAPQGGAIMALSLTSAAYLNPLRDFMRIKSGELFAKTPDARIGDVIQSSLNLYTDSLIGIQYRNHARYMLLQGDPALRLFNATNVPIDSVWPGDVNYDGVANMADLLQLGLAYGDSGYARLNPTINWEAQYCLPWDESYANGFNKKYADCDGNGVVNAVDTLAISLNYGSIHQKTEDSNFTEEGIPLMLLIPQVINPGDTAVIQVIAGDSINPSEIYGLRFKIGYDTAVVERGQMWVDFSDSWLGAEGSEILGMYKDKRYEGEIEIGMTRINRLAKFGGGKAADINIVITDDIAKQEWSLKSFTFTQGAANDETGDEVPLNALAAWNNDLPPIEPLYVRIFPNPVIDEICIESSKHQLKDFALWDFSGKQVATWTAEEVALGCLAIDDLQSGIYLLTFEEDGLRRTQKIIVID